MYNLSNLQNKMERTMTNEEKVLELMPTKSGYYEITDALLKMAEWKDEQFAKEKQALIDKACEWLKENASKHIHGNYAFLKGLMLEEFQQAMKGGNNE